MVSNVLDLDVEELYATLERIRIAHGDAPEYIAWRREFPADWPL